MLLMIHNSKSHVVNHFFDEICEFFYHETMIVREEIMHNTDLCTKNRSVELRFFEKLFSFLLLAHLTT